MSTPLPIKISDDLTVVVGGSAARLSPSQALDFAEEVARKGFRRALQEEHDVAALGRSEEARHA